MPPAFRATLARPIPALAVVSALLGTAPAVAQERFTVSGPRVAIYNLAGRVEVARGTGSAVVVEVTRGGRDATQLRVEQGPLAGIATLRVIYPGNRIAYPQGGGSTTLRVREDGTFGGTIRGNEGRSVRVADDDGLEAWADLRILVPEGLDLDVQLAVGGISARGLTATLRLDTHSGDVAIEAIRGRVVLDTGSGNVRATGVDGELTVDTGSGDVEVRDTRVGTLGVDTGSGTVRLEGVTAEALLIDTGSGGVSATGNAGRIDVDTGSGDVSLDLGDRLAQVAVDAGSGDVTLLVPAGFGAQVSLETSSGDLEVNVPLQVVRRGGDALEGTIGDGRGRIQVETGSGRITLRQK
jgi:hypothetical protein